MLAVVALAVSAHAQTAQVANRLIPVTIRTLVSLWANLSGSAIKANGSQSEQRMTSFFVLALCRTLALEPLVRLQQPLCW